MRCIAILVALWTIACGPSVSEDSSEQHDRNAVLLVPQESATTASLRGLSVVSDSTAWASGANGTYVRTTNGGESWETGTVPGAEDLDFRDVEGMDAETAYLMSAGEPAKLFETTDGGAHWRQIYGNDTPGIFFDSMAFWNSNSGIAFSDPVEGHFVIVRTTDAGATWEQVPPENLPPSNDGEAGFAASGTMVAVQGSTHAWIGTGGKTARVLRSTDQGWTWVAVETPMRHGESSTGIFSITFWDESNGMIVGGDYQDPDNQEANAALSTDGGLTWKPVDGSPPLGFRSAVAYVPHADPPMLITAGTSGVDISRDSGKTWTSASTDGYHTVAFSPSGRIGWATGAEGRIAKIHVSMN